MLAIRRPGYFLASERVLREVCTPEKFDKIVRASMPYEGEGYVDKMYDSDSSKTSTDSSNLPMAGGEPEEIGGVIGLEDIPTGQEQTQASGSTMSIRKWI